jgi:UDP-N-acetyl-D-glucosamine dehydrogenase
MAYKPDIGDIRESPSLRVMELLHRRGARVSFHDPHIESIPFNGGRAIRSDLTRRTVAGSDCVALLTPHSLYDLEWIADNAEMVFDARNAYATVKSRNVVRL